MRAAVLVVTWNSGPLLGRCLDSLARQTRLPDRIIVVDNASTDGSPRAAEGRPGVELVALPENAGFAAANNLGMARATDCELVALLNPDAFPEPGWLEALVAAAAAHPEAASFGSHMLSDADPTLIDGVGDVYHAGGLHWRQGHGAPAASMTAAGREIFSACAAAALYRRDLFLRTGGFDESFFCYAEDVDLGFRLRLLGHTCRYVPGAVVRHVGSATAGTDSAFSVYHGHRNMVWTYVKNMPGMLFWLYLPQHLLANVAALAWFSRRGRLPAVLRAKLDAVGGLGAAWQKRRAIQAQRRVASSVLRAAMTRGVLTPFISRWRRRA